MSQADVSRATGAGKSAISKYETGKELPRLASLLVLLESMGYTYYDFFHTLRVIDEQEAALAGESPRFPLPVVSGPLREAFGKVVAALFELHYACTEALVGLGRSRD